LPVVRITGSDAADRAALLAGFASGWSPRPKEHDFGGPGRVESAVETRVSSWR
jgi:hypothetical protein